jgi:hypothetical protein
MREQFIVYIGKNMVPHSAWCHRFVADPRLRAKWLVQSNDTKKHAFLIPAPLILTRFNLAIGTSVLDAVNMDNRQPDE